MQKQILHIDVNNAFLSWTAIDMLKKGYSIDIRTIPSIIGGDETQRRGVVLAKSNIAKQFGIKTGEPIYFARKKCSYVKVYPSNHKMYEQYSDKLYNFLLNYTDKIERFSIDECFLDLTEFLNKNETLYEKAINISKQIKKEFGFTVNIGVSTNKLLAKMASDFQKPDKVHTLYPNEIEQKMWILPISELFMVGRKTIPKLYSMNIKTIGDLAKQDIKTLIQKFGKHGKMMWEYANGIDKTEVTTAHTNPKCVGNSVTLPYDISNLEELNKELLKLTEQVSYRLRKQKLLAEVVNVSIKTNEFKTFSHQKKLNNRTNSSKHIYEEAKKLLKELYKGQKIRLIGVRTDKISTEEQAQISLFNNIYEKDKNLDKAIDSIKEKYGEGIITKATEIKSKNRI